MKWDSENDRKFFLMMIKTHDIRPNFEAIAKAWPEDGEKPSKRALSERYYKLQQMSGIKTSGGSKTPKTVTPRASKVSAIKTTPSSTRAKRKTTKTYKEDSDDDVTPWEGNDEDDEEVEETPTKKVKPTPPAPKPGMGRNVKKELVTSASSASPGPVSKPMVDLNSPAASPSAAHGKPKPGNGFDVFHSPTRAVSALAGGFLGGVPPTFDPNQRIVYGTPPVANQINHLPTRNFLAGTDYGYPVAGNGSAGNGYGSGNGNGYGAANANAYVPGAHFPVRGMHNGLGFNDGDDEFNDQI